MTKEPTKEKKAKASKKKVEEVEVPTKLPRRVVVYGYLVIQTVLLIVYGAQSATLLSGYRDTRSPKEMARDYAEYRNKYLDPDINITEEYVEREAKEAECVLRTMGLRPGSSKDVFYDSSDDKKKRYTPEEQKNKGVKYIRMPNAYAFVRDKRYKDTIATLKVLQKGPKTEEYYDWLKMKPEKLLKQPLAPVKDKDGNVVKDFDERPCLLLKPLAEQVTKVNKQLWSTKEVQIKPIVCYRSNLHQAVAFAGKHDCKLGEESAGLMRPANSHHGMGLAMDLANQKQVEDALKEIGVICGFIGGDEGHCSFGETDMVKRFMGIRLPDLNLFK
jgi:hypothetical protein